MGDVTIDKLIANLKSVKMQDVISSSIDATRYEAVEAQRDQMLHGKASDGKLIGKYKNPKYAQKKYAQNSEAGLGNVDLYLKGDFQKDVFIDTRDKSVVFSSADSKLEDLVDRYGDRIFGLSPSYAAQYSARHIAPEAIKRIKQKITG